MLLFYFVRFASFRSMNVNTSKVSHSTFRGDMYIAETCGHHVWIIPADEIWFPWDDKGTICAIYILCTVYVAHIGQCAKEMYDKLFGI